MQLSNINFHAYTRRQRAHGLTVINLLTGISSYERSRTIEARGGVAKFR